MMKKFKKILIANRGEIAVRIHRACREMGIETVAIHSTADNNALHVKMANESVCIGEPPADKSYLNIPAILSAAEVTDVEAIHPGYGFLSENAKFAQIVEKLGFTFIGPKSEHISMMGDKVTAIKMMKKMNVPTIPGSGGPIRKDEDAVKIAAKIGYPVLIKAAAGGGGRGMKVAHGEMALRKAISTAKAEAKAAFGDDRIYLEKFLEKPRHIEIQVIADTHGNVFTLGERDCSLQRRYQKIIEESPSPAISTEQRKYLSDLSTRICKEIGYIGAGTIEFLYENDNFYFIEMNTRLQVEHPVTEMVTGIDLVQEQIRVAMGEKLNIKKAAITLRGHAIECRINAENADTFVPSPGTVTEYFTPGGPDVRVDSCLYHNCTVSPYYDAMVAKLIVHGANREDAVRRLQRALEEFIVEGIDTILPLHQRLVATSAFAKGEYDIHSIGKFIEHKRL
jgi:acetyl-CoA carboxylase biotin carboxylase subunit